MAHIMHIVCSTRCTPLLADDYSWWSNHPPAASQACHSDSNSADIRPARGIAEPRWMSKFMWGLDVSSCGRGVGQTRGTDALSTQLPVEVWAAQQRRPKQRSEQSTLHAGLSLVTCRTPCTRHRRRQRLDHRAAHQPATALTTGSPARPSAGAGQADCMHEQLYA